jgi:hypothetical protein
VLLKLLRTAYLFIYPVADRYYYVWEPVFCYFMLRICCSIDILWLIVVPINYIPLDLVLVFPFLRLVGFILGVDPIEPPGVLTSCVLKTIVFDPAVEVAAHYSLEVSLIIIKHLVPCVVLPQDLFWSSENHSC